MLNGDSPSVLLGAKILRQTRATPPKDMPTDITLTYPRDALWTNTNFSISQKVKVYSNQHTFQPPIKAGDINSIGCV